jgi:SAM-dependent methyltransferase
MLDKYRATAADLSLDESRMIAVQGDLLAPVVQPTTPVLSEEELGGFDLVAICMALHHVDDVEQAAKRLAERLRPGGVLLIIDWATRNSSKGAEQQHHPMLSASSGKHQHRHDHHHGHSNTHGEVSPIHPAAHTISHDSFTQEQIVDLFHQAGCGESRFKLADRLSDVPGARTGKMQLFWARATKL